MSGSFPTIATGNVSTVQFLSPFRYPGGKTWLVPLIRQWIEHVPQKPVAFIEPFAGGAIIGLTVAFTGLAKHVTLVEIDENVGAVWEAIINKGLGPKLAGLIRSFAPTGESVEALLAQQDLELCELAFQTIVRNRVSRGGILVEGAGLLKNGENGRGLASRWYPRTIAKRIERIHSIRHRMSFVWGDGMQVVETNCSRRDAFFFVDPPYTAGGGKQAGRRLYRHSELDHERLFRLMEDVRGDFLMTYEDHRDVQEMALGHGFAVRRVAMKSTHHARMTELLIGRDLGWIG